MQWGRDSLGVKYESDVPVVCDIYSSCLNSLVCQSVALLNSGDSGVLLLQCATSVQ